MLDNFLIREGRSSDVERIIELIRELARFEKAESEVILQASDLLKDGFENKPAFKTLVAEIDSEVVGMALFYERYSTWKGRSLYLEDLIVTEKLRNKGIGKMLLKELISITEIEKFARLEWQVLDWNESAIQFYRSLGVEFDKEWINCRLRFK